jgi:hypothetical protein
LYLSNLQVLGFLAFEHFQMLAAQLIKTFDQSIMEILNELLLLEVMVMEVVER